MKIEKIKEMMLEYRDFYGGDLLNVDDVFNAETEDELKTIIDKHEDHIQQMERDAISHLNHFRKDLGL